MIEKKNLGGGLLFFAFGLFLGLKSLKLSVWSKFGPDEGFFPLAVAVIIMGLSFAIMIRAFISLRDHKRGAGTQEQHKMGTNVYKTSSYVVLMLLYGILLENVGFLITSSIFLFLIMKFVEKGSWVRTISVGLASILASYFLFVHFLGVPLPRGWIKGW